jgi:sec-independent protein translocase protein TatB
MFDIGFGELVVVAVVALLVVGPERLPELVRDASGWLRAVRRFATETRYQIEREMRLPDDADLNRKIADLGRLMQDAPDAQGAAPKTGESPR